MLSDKYHGRGEVDLGGHLWKREISINRWTDFSFSISKSLLHGLDQFFFSQNTVCCTIRLCDELSVKAVCDTKKISGPRVFVCLCE